MKLSFMPIMNLILASVMWMIILIPFKFSLYHLLQASKIFVTSTRASFFNLYLDFFYFV